MLLLLDSCHSLINQIQLMIVCIAPRILVLVKPNA
jgi:hypothetical protein